jgi:hypothetical protein
VNRDTGERVFITPTTFTHSFTNLGQEQISAVKKLPEIIENAVLTHRENSRNATTDHSTGVYTLFGAVYADDGVRPVKLKIKEYFVGEQAIPAMVQAQLNAADMTFSKAYDSRVLVLDSIEKEGVSSSAAAGTTETVEQEYHPSTPSTVSVAELYELVNEEFRKYLPQKGESENRTYSLDEDWEDELPDSGEQPVSGFDAYRNEDGIEDTLEDGTRLLSKQDSQNLARELRNSFGSRMRISDLSTSLRQIADTADGMVEMYLRMVQGNMTGAEAQQLWDEQYAPVEAMAYELADEIIENGETGGPLDTETHAVLREALTGDRIYVPEDLKEDVARGLGYESWGEARKARLNILGKTVNDPARGTSIDVIYNNLVDSTPFAVSGDAGNPADQLVEMIQAYDKAEKPSSRHNTLALTEEQRQENRKKIAGQ